jgi:hypothetical protein
MLALSLQTAMTAHNSKPSPGTKRPTFVVRAARRLWWLVFDRPYQYEKHRSLSTATERET